MKDYSKAFWHNGRLKGITNFRVKAIKEYTVASAWLATCYHSDNTANPVWGNEHWAHAYKYGYHIYGKGVYIL